MTRITDLFTLNELNRNIDNGMIREQSRPDFPELRILNYTEAAQFSRTWNNVTKMCRGLIYNARTLELLARPFAKIHNWDETEAPRITWDAPLYSWSDKEDGSLGIIYKLPDGRVQVATRGSFLSEQALHATELLPYLEEMYGKVSEWEFQIDHGYTPLVEIIYPENRIVLDYGSRDELIPLGMIDMDSGAYIPEPSKIGEVRTFDDIRRDLSRPNAEGYVVWLDENKAVKVKQADYVELHRIVTGLNRRSVWRALQEDGAYEALVEQVPDELTDWAKGAAKDLWEEFDVLKSQAQVYYENAKQGRDGLTQKQFALNVQQQVPRSFQGMVFALHAGKDISPTIWKAIQPRAER